MFLATNENDRRRDFDMPRVGSKLHQVEYRDLRIEIMDHPGLYYTRHHEWVQIVGG